MSHLSVNQAPPENSLDVLSVCIHLLNKYWDAICGYLKSPILFLGAFAKLRKAAINFVMCVCLSFRMEQLGFDWTDFH